jgi:hypothetical protein
MVAAGASVVSAGIGAYSSSKAAGQAAKGANAAAALQEKQYGITRGDLAPYNKAGQAAADQLQGLNESGFTTGQPNYLQMSQDAMPGTMTQSELEKTPGYRFNLRTGLQSTQSAAAARGLGVSGAAMRGAATFATGLSDSTYQQQFSNAQTRSQDFINLNTGQQANAQNLYTRLSGTAGVGENAAAQTGQAGTYSSAAGSNYLNQAGQATAAGTMGVNNSVSGTVNSGISNYLQYSGMQNGLSSGKTIGYTAPRDMSSTATG